MILTKHLNYSSILNKREELSNDISNKLSKAK
jgi:hypothetical protein